MKALLNEIAILLKNDEFFKEKIIRNLSNPKSDATDLEEITASAIKKVFQDNKYSNCEVVHLGGSKFPDIQIKIKEALYGLEIKRILHSNDNKTLGNSINNEEKESLLFPENTWAFLFKRLTDNAFDIVFKKYYDCVCGISVTHFPRFRLSFDESNSTFEKVIGCSVVEFRENPILKTMEYFKAHHSGIWGLDGGEILENCFTFYSDLTKEQKDDIRACIIIRFPELLDSNCKNDYEAVTKWLASNGVVSTSVRDLFSAGGKTSQKQNYYKKSVFERLEIVLFNINKNGSYLGVRKEHIANFDYNKYKEQYAILNQQTL